MPIRSLWKSAIIGTVTVIAGIALVLGTWALDELVAFVAMFMVARGALHIVTMSFEGATGALAALQGGGEVGVGLLLLIWPSPTLTVLVVVVGTWVIVRAVVAATLVAATRLERVGWRLQFMASLVEVAFGVALIARPSGSVESTAWILGALAVFDGLLEIVAAAAFTRVEGHGPFRSIASAP